MQHNTKELLKAQAALDNDPFHKAYRYVFSNGEFWVSDCDGKVKKLEGRELQDFHSFNVSQTKKV